MQPEGLIRKSKFSEVQIATILKEAEAGIAVAEVARKNGISAATFYQWRSKYGGTEVSDLQRMRMRELEQENARLKRMYVDLSLDNAILKEALTKKVLTPGQRRTVVSATSRSLKWNRLNGVFIFFYKNFY